MFNIFPYIFSTTLNAIYDNSEKIEEIVDKFINSTFINNLKNTIDNISSININFKEHKRAYTIQGYLPGVKKENIDIVYNNNYITIKIKKDYLYINRRNIEISIAQPNEDIEKDYYVENADAHNIKAIFKNNILIVIIPKNTYISEDTTIIEVSNYKDIK